MILKTIIVDDEPLVLSMIQELMAEFSTIEVIKTFTKPKEVIQGIRDLNPDLVFLDINMPGKNGIDLASEIIDINSNIMIVFITAYDRYAIEAFKLNALHYILKPPMKTDIQATITRALSILTNEHNIPTVREQDYKVMIKLFGNTLIVNELDEDIIHWPTAKSEELFALLLTKGQLGIDKWQIIDYLWPNSKNDKAEQVLYSTVYRTKKILKEHNIPIKLTNHLGKYTLELIDGTCDVFEFNTLYTKFKSNSLDFNSIYSTLFNHYTGCFLAEKDYTWSNLACEDFKVKFNEMYTYLEKHLLNSKDIIKLKELHTKRNKVHNILKV